MGLLEPAAAALVPTAWATAQPLSLSQGDGWVSGGRMRVSEPRAAGVCLSLVTEPIAWHCLTHSALLGVSMAAVGPASPPLRFPGSTTPFPALWLQL